MVSRLKGKKIAMPKYMEKKIPYEHCYEDMGMIFVEGRYTRMYLVGEINTENIKNYDSEIARGRMNDFFNGFPFSMSFQFLIHNRLVDQEDYLSKLLLGDKFEGTPLEDAAGEYDKVLSDNFSIGHNNVHKDLYFIASIKADTPEEAAKCFEELDVTVRDSFKSIYGIEVSGVSLVERLRVMHDIYNPQVSGFGDIIRLSDGEEIDLSNLKYMKLTTKDLVCPKNIVTKREFIDYGILNDNTEHRHYFRAFYINAIPSDISASFVSDITNVSSNMLFSVIYEPVDIDVGVHAAARYEKNATKVIKSEKRDTVADRKNRTVRQERVLKEKNDRAYFNRQAFSDLKKNYTSEDRVYSCTFAMVLFSEDLSELSLDTELLHISAEKFGASVRSLDLLQDKGLFSCLPLCKSHIDAKRVFDTKRLSKLSPIGISDAARKDGLFMGLNSINDSVILINRKNNVNLSGAIIGAERSGKTYQMKREIFNAAVGSEDKIKVISMTDEYDDYIKRLGGSIASFCMPDIFWITKGYGLLDDDYEKKAKFLSALFVSLLKPDEYLREEESERLCFGIEQECRGLAGELRDGMYDFNNVNNQNYKNIMCKYPLLLEGFNRLEARGYLREGCGGSSYPGSDKGCEVRSYSESDAVYQEGCGKGMDDNCRLSLYKVADAAEMIMVLDDLYNKAIEDKRKGINNFIFIDNADDMLGFVQASEFFVRYLDDTSSMQAITTFVIQDALQIISNSMNVVGFENAVLSCGYIKLLNEGPVERKKMEEILNIPQALMPYISNVSPGKGLIITPHSSVAFNDNYREIYPEGRFKEIFE